MKKVIIILIIFVIGLAGLNVYEYMNMQNLSQEYLEVTRSHKILLGQEVENNKIIEDLEKQLLNTKIHNVEDNKEYRTWTNLIQSVQNLLK